MDSLTQLALGAAVGEAAIGRRVGNRAILWGAIAGTLPDLDVFVPLGDVVSDFTYHRSATHSLLVLALATPLLAWLITRLHPHTRPHWKRWCLAIYLVFATHALLDSMTAYGTQIFWPFPVAPVSLSIIFIIDPLYSLPLLVGVIAALVASRESDRGHRINRYGLIASTLYLSWTLLAKQVVDHNFETALRERDIAHSGLFTTPTPFNSLLWRGVVRDEHGYREAYYSIFDRHQDIRFRAYPSDERLLDGLDGHPPVRRLRWFTRGFYSVYRRDRDIVIADLRMGLEPNYVFRFKVGEFGNPHPLPLEPEQLEPVRDLALLPLLWERILDPRVELHPAAK